MRKKLKKPVKLLNDADVQGLAVIKGKGLELVCTLGTGFGTAWFRDGELMPHMDLAHLAMHKKDDFDVYDRRSHPQQDRQQALEQAGQEADRHAGNRVRL